MSKWGEPLRRNRFALAGTGVLFLLAASVLWGLVAPRRDPVVDAIRKRGYPVTLAEVKALYPSVPDAENAALVYTNALGLLTNASGPITNFIGKGWLPPIGQGLSADEMQDLKAALAQHQAALRLLYAAPDSGRSRYPIRLEDGFAMVLPHLGEIRTAVSLLTAEALMHATEGDAEKASKAFLAAGRLADSVAEEPVIVSQLVRYASWGVLLSRLERALSLTPFTEGQLAALQRMIESAERPQAARHAWEAEQAGGLAVFTDRNAATTAFRGFQNQVSRSENLRLAACLSVYRLTGLMQRDKAFYCDTLGKHLSAMELPFPAQYAAAQRLGAVVNVPNRFCVFSRMLLPALGRLHTREADHVSLVRVAAAALAIERFRLGHSQALPENLGQLAPALCKTVPADPIDGAPLRYKTNGAGYVVYSIGSDGQDDGGVVWDSNFVKVPQDVAFVVKH